MTVSIRSHRSFTAAICNHSGRFIGAIVALFFLLPVFGTLVLAQTTTISGTVYDPRTTSSALISKDFHKSNYLANLGMNHVLSLNEKSFIKTQKEKGKKAG